VNHSQSRPNGRLTQPVAYLRSVMVVLTLSASDKCLAPSEPT
jgi:hypothetical protein